MCEVARPDLSGVDQSTLLTSRAPASWRKPCMCPEQTGSHQSRARVGRGSHQIQIREPTIRRGHQKNVHPCMSNEVEVLEGGVSKDAVFGRKVGGDDVRVVHVGARLSAMGNCSFWIITSPQSPAHLHRKNTCEGHARCLATFASRHYEQPKRRCGRPLRRHRCGTRAQGSLGWNHSLERR